MILDRICHAAKYSQTCIRDNSTVFDMRKVLGCRELCGGVPTKHEQNNPTHTNGWHTYKRLLRSKHVYDREVMGKHVFSLRIVVIVLEIVDKKCHFSVKCSEFCLLRCAFIKSNMYRQKWAHVWLGFSRMADGQSGLKIVPRISWHILLYYLPILLKKWIGMSDRYVYGALRVRESIQRAYFPGHTTHPKRRVM